MEISSRKTKLFGLLNGLYSGTFDLWLVQQYNTPMKENRSWWFGLPKLMVISQETSTWWKRHNNRIWFQTKDNVMMVPGRIGFAKILWFVTPPFSFIKSVPELLYTSLGVGRHHIVHDSSHGIRGLDLIPLHTNVSVWFWTCLSILHLQLGWYNFL